MDNTLRKVLWGFLRPLVQLITNLLSPQHGGEWEWEFKKFLRKEPCWVKPTFDLYLFGRQNSGGFEVGFDIQKHLIVTGLMTRTLSLEDQVVKDWISNPGSYPKEFRDKTVVLWKSKRTSGLNLEVAGLCWSAGCVVVRWRWLGDWWRSHDPALFENF